MREVSCLIMRFIGYRTILPLWPCSAGLRGHRLIACQKMAIEHPISLSRPIKASVFSPSRPGGALLVLNFWETSCVSCVAELPSLSGFADKFRSKHVVVVAVSGDEDL
jgi:thiol-disulfide isomerase/thioredoxin